MKFRLGLALTALSAVAAAETVKLWDGAPVPRAAELERLEGAEFSVVKKHEPEQDGYDWLHGVALCWHKGRLWASYGTNRGKENTPTEEAHVRVSDDGGKTWGAVQVVAKGENGQGFSHGALASHDGVLWCFAAAISNKCANTQTYAFTLDESHGRWIAHGAVIGDGFWPMQGPMKMADGNWLMGGLHIGAKGAGDRSRPAVAISRGDDFTRWDVSIVNEGEVPRCWGEATADVWGPCVTLTMRPGWGANPPVAYIATSADYGRSWTPLKATNLPLATSKPFTGILSTGQRYVISQTTADGGTRRQPLTIAVSRPGEWAYSRVYLIRPAVFPEGPGESHPKASLAYPYAVEHDGKLYVAYSNGGGRGGNRNSAELAVLPVASLRAEPVSEGAETLTWNGKDGDTWGGAAQNWMDESGRACAWKNGAEAVFAGSACRVRAAKGVKAASVRFRANGVRLEGEAEMPVLIADGGTSNTVALVDAAPRATVRGGGMLVCAASARFDALDVEAGFVRIADDGVATKVNVGEAGCLNTMKRPSFQELVGEGRVWEGELPTPRVIPFNNDFDSGLSTNKTYTHLYDFGTNPTNAVANLVKFNRVGGVITVGMDWKPCGSGNLMRMENVGVPRHHGLYHLFSDFAVGFEPDKPLRFKRLKKGHWHRIAIYQRAFEQPGNRRRGAVLSFDMDGDGPLPPASITVWQNLHPVSRIEYDFYAVEEDSLTLRIRNLDPAMGFHLYGLSIEVCDEGGRAGARPSRVCPSRGSICTALRERPRLSRPLRDLMSDTWAAVDGLNRELPGAAAVGAPRVNRSVGIFYWTWHCDAYGPYDNTKLTAAARNGIVSWPPCAAHWWGESEYGYYRADDEYVLTHHAILLAAAGVDVVLFDTTNPPWTFKEQYEALCRAWTRLREQGTPTPQIAFICPFTAGGHPQRAEITVDQLWYDLYKPGKWKDLWYRWQGKPLILADPRSAKLPGMKEFFTFRYPEPDYRRGPTAPDQWSWLEVSPQHVFTNSLGQAEQMSVGVSVNALPGVPGPAPMSHKDGAMGRSWHDGKIDPDPAAVNRGIFFQNQWNWALKHDPLFVFVTGWNEWRAGRMTKWSRYDGETDCYFPGGLFVDEYNQEYSRDCEPMKGGHGDNYYYQLVANIRRYKGARPAPAATRTYAIGVDGAFADWADVQPTYRDAVGDTVHRDHAGCGENIHYTDASGRNDIADLKVAETPQGDVAFYAQTANTLSPHTDPNWMLLFVNADAKQTTGWYGYDLRVNRDISADGTTASLDAWRGPVVGGYWECVGRVPIRIGAREIELTVPRKFFGTAPLHFQFHWKDNPETLGRHPTIQGDDAPERRFNYAFTASPRS